MLWLIGYLFGISAMLGVLLSVTTEEERAEKDLSVAILVCAVLWPMVIVAVVAKDSADKVL